MSRSTRLPTADNADTATSEEVDWKPKIARVGELIRVNARTFAKFRFNVGVPSLGDVQGTRSAPPWLGITFGMFVLLPVLVTALYFAFFSANQYTAEMHFAVRGHTQSLMNGGGGIAIGRYGAFVMMNDNQESNIVVNYIESSAMLNDLADELDLKAIFSRPAFDFWARLESNPSSEVMLNYWRHMVSTKLEAISGIITVRVTTFSPDDSLAVANTILAKSETFVNKMTANIREDSLLRAENEIRRATEQVTQARLDLENFRNKEKLINPDASANSIFETIMKLRESKIEIENEFSIALAKLSEDSPALREMRSRLNALDTQIKAAEARLMSTGDKVGQSTLEAIRAYEELRLKEQFAESYLFSTERSMSFARSNIESNHLYLEAYVLPSLPQRASFPSKSLGVFIVFFGSLVLWTIGLRLTNIVAIHND